MAASYKDRHWSYEQEWRLINPDGARTEGQAVLMPMKAVYLGTRISPGDAAKVMRAAQQHELPVFKMQLAREASTLAFAAVAA